MAASSSIAAVRPAVRHEFFAMETQAAISAITGFYMNVNFINKHLCCLRRLRPNMNIPMFFAAIDEFDNSINFCK